MPAKRTMILTADKLSIATHRAEVVVLLDLSGAGVFPELEIGFRLLPAEARGFAPSEGRRLRQGRRFPSRDGG